MYKHRPLVKPIMIVTTTGYIVSALGPYLADSKNSDAKILNHVIATNTEEIKQWAQPDDTLVVDRGRGFRNSFGRPGHQNGNAILSTERQKTTYCRRSKVVKTCY
jgi:hypothetical protein